EATGDAVGDDVRVDPHRRGDGRDGGGHVLESFAGAFAARVDVVDQRHEAHVELADQVDFRGVAPVAKLHGDTGHLGRCVAHDAEDGVGELLVDLRQNGLQGREI